jgi:hypothetical protein
MSAYLSAYGDKPLPYMDVAGFLNVGAEFTSARRTWIERIFDQAELNQQSIKIRFRYYWTTKAKVFKSFFVWFVFFVVKRI